MTTPEIHIPTGDQPLPRRWPDTEFFWASGRDGLLRLLRCHSCNRFAHPPAPICRYCRSSDLGPEAVSGDARLWSFSIVHQPFVTWIDTPYVIGVVEVAEDAEIHLTTRIVDCQPEDVEIGMPLRVRFEQHGWVYLPLFAPASLIPTR